MFTECKRYIEDNHIQRGAVRNEDFERFTSNMKRAPITLFGNSYAGEADYMKCVYVSCMYVCVTDRYMNTLT